MSLLDQETNRCPRIAAGGGAGRALVAAASFVVLLAGVGSNPRSWKASTTLMEAKVGWIAYVLSALKSLM